MKKLKLIDENDERKLARKGHGKVGTLPVPTEPTEWILLHRDGRSESPIAQTAFEACRKVNWRFSDVVVVRYKVGDGWVTVV